MSNALLIHVPHASTALRGSFVLSETALNEEVNILTDWHMDELFKGVDSVVFPYSRLYCDVERYSDDSQEPMSELGMGFYYVKTHDGAVLRNLDEAEKEAIKTGVYTAHHKLLSEKAQKIIDEHGFCILIDCHSYDDSLPWVDGMSCPDICLGLNESNPKLEQAVSDLCAEYGYSFAVNTPFAGTILPNDADASKIFSVMLEVNKRLYGGRQRDEIAFSKLGLFANAFSKILIELLYL